MSASSFAPYGQLSRSHTSLFRQVEDVRAPVNADLDVAYRIPLHLLILSAGCCSLLHGAC